MPIAWEHEVEQVMIKNLKIWWYKRKARAAYNKYMGLRARASGSSLRSRAEIRHANEYNKCIDKLNKLGEKVPDYYRL